MAFGNLPSPEERRRQLVQKLYRGAGQTGQGGIARTGGPGMRLFAGQGGSQSAGRSASGLHGLVQALSGYGGPSPGSDPQDPNTGLFDPARGGPVGVPSSDPTDNSIYNPGDYFPPNQPPGMPNLAPHLGGDVASQPLQFPGSGMNPILSMLLRHYGAGRDMG